MLVVALPASIGTVLGGLYATRNSREGWAVLGLPAQLAAVGVRLVHTVRFDESMIDGAAFFDDVGPVIGLSGRTAKLDSVLFTLLHEIAHIHLGHVEKRGAVDIYLLGAATSVRERRAGKTATQWALPRTLSIKAPISRGGGFSPAPSRWAGIPRWLSGRDSPIGYAESVVKGGRRCRRTSFRSPADAGPWLAGRCPSEESLRRLRAAGSSRRWPRERSVALGR